jgi:hypothetical protein
VYVVSLPVGEARPIGWGTIVTPKRDEVAAKVKDATRTDARFFII